MKKFFTLFLVFFVFSVSLYADSTEIVNRIKETGNISVGFSYRKIALWDLKTITLECDSYATMDHDIYSEYAYLNLAEQSGLNYFQTAPGVSAGLDFMASEKIKVSANLGYYSNFSEANFFNFDVGTFYCPVDTDFIEIGFGAYLGVSTFNGKLGSVYCKTVTSYGETGSQILYNDSLISDGDDVNVSLTAFAFTPAVNVAFNVNEACSIIAEIGAHTLLGSTQIKIGEEKVICNKQSHGIEQLGGIFSKIAFSYAIDKI